LLGRELFDTEHGRCAFSKANASRDAH
jgi:hypothetical protein